MSELRTLSRRRREFSGGWYHFIVRHLGGGNGGAYGGGRGGCFGGVQ